MVKEISEDQFQKEVIEAKGLVFVDFYAQWCGPCRITAPIIEELSQEQSAVKFLKVNVDKNPGLVSQYSIFSIPTCLLFKEGKLVSQMIGARNKQSFLEEIKKFLD